MEVVVVVVDDEREVVLMEDRTPELYTNPGRSWMKEQDVSLTE